MTYKKAILFSIFVFSALFLMSFASAGVLTINSTSYSSSASHNSAVTVTFSVAYSGSLSSTTANFSASTTNIGTWTLPTNTVIANDSVLVPLSATLNVPKHASGTITAMLKVDGNASATDNVSISIPITSSSTLDITDSQSLTKTQNGIINVTNTGNVDFTNINLSASGDFNVSFSSNNLNVIAGASTLVTLTSLVNLSDRSITDLGANVVTISAANTSGTVFDTFSYTIYEDFCDYSNVNTTEVDIISIEDSNDWEWDPLDKTNVEVEVENKMDDDEDFVVEIGLWDSEKNKFIDLEDENTLEDYVSIDEDDTEKVKFDFEVPIELDNSDGRYILFAKAYVDGKEKRYCNSYAGYSISDGGEPIEVNKKSKDVSLGEMSYPEIVVAGETVTITARAFNIGSSDQDKVMVAISNTKLELDLESSSFELDSGDSNSVDFTFLIPTTAENGIYTLKLYSYFDYKKSSDYYAKDEDYSIKITVAGGVNVTTTSAGLSQITPTLESDVKAGEDLEVITTIKNLGSKSAIFVVNILDYESWASLNSISDRVITLAAGESRDIIVSLKVNEDVTGEQTFKIESRSGTKIDSKIVAVEMEDESWLSSLGGSFGSNTILWIIGAINVALIGLIVYLAIRFFKK